MGLVRAQRLVIEEQLGTTRSNGNSVNEETDHATVAMRSVYYGL